MLLSTTMKINDVGIGTVRAIRCFVLRLTNGAFHSIVINSDRVDTCYIRCDQARHERIVFSSIRPMTPLLPFQNYNKIKSYNPLLRMLRYILSIIQYYHQILINLLYFGSKIYKSIPSDVSYIYQKMLQRCNMLLQSYFEIRVTCPRTNKLTYRYYSAKCGGSCNLPVRWNRVP